MTKEKQKKKGSGTPTDVCIEPPRLTARRVPSGARRLSAFHRGSCGGDRTPPLSSRPRFLGRGNVPVPVQRAPRRPVIVPAGRIVRSRPEAECIVPPAGTALAPPSGVPSAEGVLHLSEIRRVHRVLKMGTHVNENVTSPLEAPGTELASPCGIPRGRGSEIDLFTDRGMNLGDIAAGKLDDRRLASVNGVRVDKCGNAGCLCLG
jgi:hypothetical protein